MTLGPTPNPKAEARGCRVQAKVFRIYRADLSFKDLMLHAFEVFDLFLK